jgi:RNA polymerase sigma factor (sigma-70 family)
VLERGHQYDGKSKFEAWLFAIARHLVIDWQRAKKAQSLDALTDPELERPLQIPNESEPSPLHQVLAQENEENVHASLGKIPAIYREVLVLRFQEELQIEEMAGVLSIPVSTVKSRLYRGLEALRGCIAFETVPPIYHLTGLHPIEAGEGACTFAMPASPWLCSPQPVLYGGAIALLADAALSCAVMTTVTAGSSFASLDLKVNYLRPVPPDGRMLQARAKLVHRGRSMALAEAELFNEDGKKIAIASSSAIVLNRPWSELASVADREVPAPET